MPNVHFQMPNGRPISIQRMQRALRVSETLAQVLVNRGLSTPALARRFLAAEESHEIQALTGLADVAERVLAAIGRGRRITVHGDYDVDGVCGSALLLRSLRALGGAVDWHIPRRSEGYGLRGPTVSALACRGTQMLITVDCGITAVEEVRLASHLGIETIITDHHAPRADGLLPEAVIVHPGVCGYPCPHLCGTAVAYKLAQALWACAGRDQTELERELDLVGLATVADVVPLHDENRALARAGQRAIGATTRVGLRELLLAAHLDPSRVDERAIGFGLAPRLNAVGRLHDSGPALELLITENPQRARVLAAELDRCNSARREIEQQIRIEADAQIRAAGPLPGYVLAAEGWHPGVIGIVAARLAERHCRPVVLVALHGSMGRGSARSIPTFDMLGGLRACGAHLTRYGGHRAAAGLELEREQLPGFAAAFAEHADRTLSAADLTPTERVDAVVEVGSLGIALAEELRSLAPFGHGNPPVSLMIADARVSGLQRMGGGKHLRFVVSGGGASAKAVAFNVGSPSPITEGSSITATFELQVNEWREVTEPRLLLRRLATRQALPLRSPASATSAQPLQMQLALP